MPLPLPQLMPLTVSFFSKIQIGFTFLVPAHPGSPGLRAIKQVCVRVCGNTVLTKFIMFQSFISIALFHEM